MATEKLKKYLFLSLLLFAACKPISNRVDVNRLNQGGYGYEIYYHGKKYITQQNIPAINQNIGFKTRADARKVGTLVMRKMLHNPNELPDVTIRELDSLKIRY